jgi:hypothetical protein
MNVQSISAWMSVILFVAAVIGWFSSERFRHITRLVARFPKGVVLGAKLAKLGVGDFYSCRDEMYRRRGSVLLNTIKHAKSSIGIIAISLQKSIAHQGLDKDLERLLNENPALQVNISLLSPKSSLVPYIAAASGRSENELRDAIKGSIKKIEAVQAKMNTPARERIILKLCDFHLFNTLVAIDVPQNPKDTPQKDAFFIVEHSLFGISISDRYTIEVVRPGSRMFKKIRDSYSAVLNLENERIA